MMQVFNYYFCPYFSGRKCHFFLWRVWLNLAHRARENFGEKALLGEVNLPEVTQPRCGRIGAYTEGSGPWPFCSFHQGRTCVVAMGAQGAEQELRHLLKWLREGKRLAGATQRLPCKISKAWVLLSPGLCPPLPAGCSRLLHPTPQLLAGAWRRAGLPLGETVSWSTPGTRRRNLCRMPTPWTSPEVPGTSSSGKPTCSPKWEKNKGGRVSGPEMVSLASLLVLTSGQMSILLFAFSPAFLLTVSQNSLLQSLDLTECPHVADGPPPTGSPAPSSCPPPVVLNPYLCTSSSEPPLSIPGAHDSERPQTTNLSPSPPILPKPLPPPSSFKWKVREWLSNFIPNSNVIIRKRTELFVCLFFVFSRAALCGIWRFPG